MQNEQKESKITNPKLNSKRLGKKKARRNAKNKRSFATVTNNVLPVSPDGVNGVGGTIREDTFLEKLGIEVTLKKWMTYSNSEIVGKGSDGLVYGMKEEVNTCQGITSQVLKVHESAVSVLTYEGEDGTCISKAEECDAVSNMKKDKIKNILTKKRRRAPEGSSPNITQMKIDEYNIDSGDALNEAIVHRACSLCSEKEFTPHITLCSRAAWNPRHLEAYLWLERYDFTLDSFAQSHLRWWNKQRFCAFFFQIFHSLHVMQEILQLKHHDLHDQNVAVKRIDSQTLFRGKPLEKVTHFMYNVGDKLFFVPNIKYLIKLSDFGFSSVSLGGKRVKRVDLDHFNDKPSQYGFWDADLEEKHGYDLQVLLGGYCTPSLKTLCSKNKEIGALMRIIYNTALGPNGRNTRFQRPLPGYESDVKPSQLILNLFGAEGSCTSFMTDPRDQNLDSVVVADMTVNIQDAASHFDELFQNL